MTVEAQRNPENRPAYTYLLKNVPEESLDYYIAATLKRNFSFPIDFRSVVMDPVKRVSVPSISYDVMVDGSRTASTIKEIEESIKVNSTEVELVKSARAGDVPTLHTLASNAFQEEYLNRSSRDNLPSANIYRAFLLAYDNFYRKFEGKDRTRFATNFIHNDRMRNFYNSLKGEFEHAPLDQEKIMDIITGAIKNTFDEAQSSGSPIRKPQGF